jgi:hypothetical protein
MDSRRDTNRSRSHAPWALVALFLLAACVPACAEEVDRLLAAVNARVITASDLRLARSLNSLMAYGSKAADRTARQELERVIDLELLRQELENSPGVRADEARIDAALATLRQGYAEIGGLPGLLERLGLQERELREYVALQISVDNFFASRFRPFVPIAPEEIRSYYEATLVPRLRGAGARVPPLEEVSAEIDTVLREEKVSPAVEQWLKEIRRHSRIELFVSSEPPSEVAR